MLSLFKMSYFVFHVCVVRKIAPYLEIKKINPIAEVWAMVEQNCG